MNKKPSIGLLNFEGDLFKAIDNLDGTFTILNEKRKDVLTTDALGILEIVEGGKEIVGAEGNVFNISNEHPNAKPTQKKLYDFLKIDNSF